MADDEESSPPPPEEEPADAPPAEEPQDAEAAPVEDEQPAGTEEGGDVTTAVAEELEAAIIVDPEGLEEQAQEGEEVVTDEGGLAEGDETGDEDMGIADNEGMEEEGEEDAQVSKSLTNQKRVSMAGVQETIIPEEDDDLIGPDGEVDDIGGATEDTVGKREALFKKKQKVLGSVISIRRGDGTYYDRQKVPKFQNSYRLEPDKPFNSEKVTQILQEVLEEALQDLVYDQDKVPKQAKWASSAIRAKVKEQEYDRYKIICYVTIGEKLCQDVQFMLRFLWDAERDSFAKYVHETMNLFAVGLCFGVYYE